jgi:hypothetical protein
VHYFAGKPRDCGEKDEPESELDALNVGSK